MKGAILNNCIDNTAIQTFLDDSKNQIKLDYPLVVNKAMTSIDLYDGPSVALDNLLAMLVYYNQSSGTLTYRTNFGESSEAIGHIGTLLSRSWTINNNFNWFQELDYSPVNQIFSDINEYCCIKSYCKQCFLFN